MLASVRSSREAVFMLGAGVDILDLKDPGTGVLGALAAATLRKITKLVDGRVTVSATVGDLPYDGEILRRATESTARCGVDIVKVGVFGDARDTDPLHVLTPLCRAGLRVVLVLLAELYRAPPDFQAIARIGIRGIMLDTRDKHDGGLTRKLPRPQLQQFVSGAREAGLLTGLAGGLTARDVPDLKSLGADYLGFRGALCRKCMRGNELDPAAVSRIRALIDSGDGIPDSRASEWQLRPAASQVNSPPRR